MGEEIGEPVTRDFAGDFALRIAENIPGLVEM
jgi:hypothetical protein